MADIESSSSVVFEKQRRGKALTGAQKQTVLNVFKQLRQDDPDKSKNEVITETVKLTGVSNYSVYKILTEAQKGRLTTSSKTRPGAVGKRTRMQVYDEFTRSAIRRKVHECYMRHELPTIKKVRAAVEEDPALPTLRKTAMQNMMKTLNFIICGRRRYSFLVENDEIVLWRRRYLRTMRKYRQQNKSVYFVDETWVNIDSSVDDKQVSTSGTSGKGQRLIVIHAGNENGFVDGAEFAFVGEKSGRFHELIDGECFETWFVKQLLPNIEPNSVIVMDNALCHCVKVEPPPARDSTKDEMQRWLTDKEISWDPTMLKSELMQLIQRDKCKYDVYRIDNLAFMNGHKVLRLPPNHCDLNPFELVWTDVKSFVQSQKVCLKWKEDEQLLPKALASVTDEKWAEYVCQTQKEEDKLWELDDLAEVLIENKQWTEASDEELSDADENGEPHYETYELQVDIG